VGWLWYLITLLPTIGLVQVGTETMADRFVYPPQIGLCVALVWSIASALTSRNAERTGRFVAGQVALSAAACLAVSALAVCAARQTAFWRDDVAVWQRALDCTTGNFIARLHLGLALSGRGDRDKAVEQYKLALADFPDFPEAHYNLAVVLSDRGQIDEAERHYRAALKVRPNHLKVRNNLGSLLYSRGDYPAAAEQFQKAIDVDPRYAMAQNNLGLALMAMGRYDAAAGRFRAALNLDPDLSLAHAYLGFVLGRLGQSAAAASELRGFLRRQSRNPEVLTWLAWVLATTRDEAVRNGPEALALAQKAATASPADPRVLDALAAAYAATSDYPAAMKTARAARAAAQAAGLRGLAAEIGQRIDLYLRSQPFRE
jgi:tetratricopeptide (TPR) repeat protein